jgi:hypothetical protein
MYKPAPAAAWRKPKHRRRILVHDAAIHPPDYGLAEGPRMPMQLPHGSCTWHMLSPSSI